jgi:hypothetical protein
VILLTHGVLCLHLLRFLYRAFNRQNLHCIQGFSAADTIHRFGSSGESSDGKRLLFVRKGHDVLSSSRHSSRYLRAPAGTSLLSNGPSILRTSLISFYFPIASAIIGQSVVSEHLRDLALPIPTGRRMKIFPAGERGSAFGRIAEPEIFDELLRRTSTQGADLSRWREYSSLFLKCGRCWLSSDPLSGSKSVGSSFLATTKSLTGQRMRLLNHTLIQSMNR